MIYLLTTEEQRTSLMINNDVENKPLGLDDFWCFPSFDEEGTDIGVVAANGDNILFVPTFPVREEPELCRANLPASSHYKWGNDQPILAPTALLITDIADLTIEVRKLLRKPIKDGLISPRWGLKKYVPTKHSHDCMMKESHFGLTYVLTGEAAGTYRVEIFEETERVMREEEETNG